MSRSFKSSVLEINSSRSYVLSTVIFIYEKSLKITLIKFFSGIINMYSTFGIDVFENFVKITYEITKNLHIFICLINKIAIVILYFLLFR